MISTLIILHLGNIPTVLFSLLLTFLFFTLAFYTTFKSDRKKETLHYHCVLIFIPAPKHYLNWTLAFTLKRATKSKICSRKKCTCFFFSSFWVISSNMAMIGWYIKTYNTCHEYEVDYIGPYWGEWKIFLRRNIKNGWFLYFFGVKRLIFD